MSPAKNNSATSLPIVISYFRFFLYYPGWNVQEEDTNGESGGVGGPASLLTLMGVSLMVQCEG